ncbi:MAG: sulfur carrier protein ThiS [Gammaproteobacteria bacterium]|nr:sulfur carrier protein ThiS [Gammaproteobacteria bacterium]MCY4270691.1 sulfur carrier protein ThiS [Gammaproteobacteria bacterium]MCY4296742.1 sulfur carrier protein ThiS [Gammaproteobacteria bacterium]
MELIVNGEPRSLPAPLSVAGLLSELGMTGRRIALELNGEILPRSEFGQTMLSGGDTLEIVQAIGGG